MKKIRAVLCFMMMINGFAFAQPFSHADTLRGSNGPARAWWDATRYDLHVTFNIEDSSIRGYNIIDFDVLQKDSIVQIDLQQPMVIDSVLYAEMHHYKDSTGEKYWEKITQVSDVRRDGNVYFIGLPGKHIKKGMNSRMIIYYHGRPKVAKKAPWDGGIIWKKDKSGSPWVTVACQGLGASVWYPCKDYQADEPASAAMHFTVPDTLVAVSNGRLKGKQQHDDGTATYTWAVQNPINSYNIIPYIGKYVHWSETYDGEKGKLTMDYWVLDSSLEKAKKQFKDAPRMMKAFEYWFGPYPFYEDGYKLIEAPHLGMEHQSAIAYGNGFKNGYYGSDLSGSGEGLKWDFIIVHESGHEWFGNNITSKDVADMWVHEGFTNYSETLFTEYFYGKEAATAYVTGIRSKIQNDKPIVGHYGVQNEGSGDMYYKAGNMIHTIRQVIDDDNLFRKILRGLNKQFYHQTVTGKQVENYISRTADIDLSKIFDQYLRTTMIPRLEYKLENGNLYYRWANVVKGFNMPVKVKSDKGGWIFIYPSLEFTKAPKDVKRIVVDPNFYVDVKKLEGDK